MKSPVNVQSRFISQLSAVLLAAGLTAFGVLCAAPACAENPLDLLRQAIKADGKVRYEARVEIVSREGGAPGQTVVQRILKDDANRHRTEVIAPPYLVGRLIISDGTTEWEFHPRARLVHQRKLRPPSEVQRVKLEQLDLVSDSLHVTYLGIATVAGRPCDVVSIRPQGDKVTRKQVWIDEKTHVELRWERYDSAGRLTTRWTVTSIDYSPSTPPGAFSFIPPKGVKVWKIPAAERMSLAEAEKRIGFKAVLPGYVPPGYTFHRSDVGITVRGGRSALWLRYLNGVDSFSIFQSQRLKVRPGPMPETTYWEAGDYSFLLVGRLSSQERQKIVDSVRP
ncbi:MAG: hypothetical protein HPY44_03060 [Armatimonadetes bacterium]|nr:hypothetical protein [Armatimonadota bacterium]